MLKTVLSSLKISILDQKSSQLLTGILQPSNNLICTRLLHITSSLSGIDQRRKREGVMKKDDGSEGEFTIGIDNIAKRQRLFPDMNTPNTLFNGIPYKEIPIVNIKCSPNNTMMCLTDYKGSLKMFKSCGTEGFKHARKATNIAAQATAISLSTKALDQGYKTIRVRVRGLGPGRMSAIKGLQMGGMDIVSITDNTRVSWCPLRPRKAKRL
ncbi:GSCOCG00009865001-RA-CDS [Cotesia congregata]|uniref:Mitochondrial (Homo sapiens) n=1 Tax=Cotesia congregata TaxID=51543 RepID=A0A8J2HJK0_COTCN|nr:GSCOCG00009865001-RA-CDS [Cotesia congregata]CAG5093435.1 Similar to MRPS11: 28S ribosomal protein S11 [Cotesia congregata]